MKNYFKPTFGDRVSDFLFDLPDKYDKAAEGLAESLDKALDKVEEKADSYIARKDAKMGNNTISQSYSGINCPKCGSPRTIINKKGFNVGNAILGGILLTPIGALLGFAGSNKLIGKCLDCHFNWKFDKVE
jgi:hypothetical protein